MQYLYAEKANYSHLSPWVVIYGKSWATGFPVRLLKELYMRAKRLLKEIDLPYTLYDPMCWTWYILTILGYSFWKEISWVYGSDINLQSLEIAKKNFSLLTEHGLSQRKWEIEWYIQAFWKNSHKEALKQCALRENRHIDTNVNFFSHDIWFSQNAYKVHMIFCDLPYGDLTTLCWDSDLNTVIENMYQTMCVWWVFVLVSHESLKSVPIVGAKTIKREKLWKRYIYFLQ